MRHGHILNQQTANLTTALGCVFRIAKRLKSVDFLAPELLVSYLALINVVRAIIDISIHHGFIEMHIISRTWTERNAKMADQLTEIPAENLPKLSDLYKSRVSNARANGISVTTIENYIDWIKIDPDLAHVTFYCLNGDFSDGTFAVIVRCS